MDITLSTEIYYIISCLILLIFILLEVLYVIFSERKSIGSLQRRKGPNFLYPFGLTQSIADGVKLLCKEIILHLGVNSLLFSQMPMLAFFLPFLTLLVLPFNYEALSDITCGLLYFMALSGINIYTILLSGWASDSKYSLLGGLRSTSQMISYELSLSFILIIISLCTNSLNIAHIIIVQEQLYISYIFSLFPLAIVFFASMLAELNRHPFDLPEAESEYVSGFNTEMSGILYAFYPLAEVIHIIIMAFFFSLFFLGGPNFPIIFFPLYSLNYTFIYELFGIFFWGFKSCIIILFIFKARTLLPRYRYDQLMLLGWKYFLPITFGIFNFYLIFLYCNDSFIIWL